MVVLLSVLLVSASVLVVSVSVVSAGAEANTKPAGAAASAA